MDLLDRLTDTLPSLVVPGLLGLIVTTLIELSMPHERHTLRGRIAGLVFWLVGLPVGWLALVGYKAIWAAIGVEPVNLAVGSPAPAWIAAIVAPVLAAFVYDFFFYWFHRAQHRWAWRFHAVHHSIRELNAVNAYHHVSEPLFQLAFLLIPASLVTVDAGVAVAAVLILLRVQASYIHSPTRLDLGPLRAVFVDNRFHRIHHSLDQRHFDKNFGACTTLWDRLFGTAWFPVKDEWPAVGLAEVDQPRTVREWVDLPSRLKRAGSPESSGIPDAI